MQQSNASLTSRIFIVLFMLLSVFRLEAQTKASWSVTLDKPMKWSTILNTGMMLICTKDSVYALDSDNRKITWQLAQIGDIEREQLREIEETPFLLINNLGDYMGQSLIKALGSAKVTGRFGLINSYTGKFVFDSGILGWDKILGQKLMLESGAFFVMGIKEKERVLAMVDVFGDGLKWQQSVPIKTKKFTFKDTDFYAPDIDPQGNFIFSYANQLFRLNKEDGTVMWSQPYPGIRNISFEAENKDVFFATAGFENALNAFDLKTGLPEWFDVLPAKLGNLFKGKEKREDALIHTRSGNTLQELSEINKKLLKNIAYRIPEQDSFMVVSNNSFNYIHKKTGKLRWDQPVHYRTLKEGSIRRVIPFPEGYLVYLKMGDIPRLHLVDQAGKSIWKTPTQVGGTAMSQVYVLTDYGVVYMSNTEIGILDKITGKPRMRRPFILDYEDGYLPYFDWEKGKAYVYQKKSMFMIDFANAASQEVVKKIKFKGDGKDFPTIFEPIEGGYFLANEQNYLQLKFDGTVGFQGYYRRPGTPMWLRRATAGALKVVTAAAMAFVSYQVQKETAEAYFNGGISGASASKTIKAYDLNNPENPTFAVGGAMFLAFNKIEERKKATVSLHDEMLMLSKLEEGGVGLVRIHKQRGEKTGEISIPDKIPEYSVDAISRRLYFFPNRKEVQIFEME